MSRRFPVLVQVLDARLASPAYRCFTVELGGLHRSNCRWPFTCCATRRPRWALSEHGSPASPPGPPERSLRALLLVRRRRSAMKAAEEEVVPLQSAERRCLSAAAHDPAVHGRAGARPGQFTGGNGCECGMVSLKFKGGELKFHEIS